MVHGRMNEWMNVWIDEYVDEWVARKFNCYVVDVWLGG